MEVSKRNTAFDELRLYDYTVTDNQSYVEVTEWTNQEGWDVIICNKQETQRVSLTHGMLKAINHLTGVLDREWINDRDN